MNIDDISFPVPIRRLVRSQKIDIVEADLNPGDGFNINYTKGRLSHLSFAVNPDRAWSIYIDSHQSDDSMRYMLAHELSHFIFRLYGVNENKVSTLNNCIDPLFPVKFEEQCADIMAGFMLFPIQEVAELFNNYIDYLKDDQDDKMDTYDWLNILSYRAGVPLYYTSICYQHIRYVMNYYHLIMNNEIEKPNNKLCFGQNSFYQSFVNKYDTVYKNLFK